jgi:hypothetical protein
VEEWGPCPVFASFTLAFALQLREKHGKTSVRGRKTSASVQYTYYQNTHTLQNRHIHTHPHTHYKTHTHTHTHTHKHTHTHTHTQLQDNIKPPQYKLKQTQYKMYPNESHDTIKCPQYTVTLMYIAHIRCTDLLWEIKSTNTSTKYGTFLYFSGKKEFSDLPLGRYSGCVVITLVSQFSSVICWWGATVAVWWSHWWVNLVQWSAGGALQ